MAPSGPRLAAEHPDRWPGRFLGGASTSATGPTTDRARSTHRSPNRRSTTAWGAHYNAEYWRNDFPGFAAWFIGEKIFSEPHSTKAIEDGIGWMLETDAETLITVEYGPYLWPPTDWGPGAPREGRAMPFVRRVRCPSLVIHGTDDRIVSLATAERLASELGAPLLEVAGGGHAPNARWPVLVNRAIRDFVRDLP